MCKKTRTARHQKRNALYAVAPEDKKRRGLFRLSPLLYRLIVSYYCRGLESDSRADYTSAGIGDEIYDLCAELRLRESINDLLNGVGNIQVA